MASGTSPSLPPLLLLSHCVNRRTPVACLLGPLASGINKLRASLAIPHSNETGAKPARTWTVTCVRVASGEFTRQLPSSGLTASDNKLSGNSGNSHRTLKNSLGQLKPRGKYSTESGQGAGQVEFCLSNRNLPGKTLGSTSNFPLAIFPLTLAAFYRCCRYFLSLTSFSYNLPQLTRGFRLQHFAEAPLISLFPLLLPRPHPQFIKSKQQYEEKRRLSQNGFHSLLLRLLLLCLLLITLLQVVRLVAAFSAN